MHPRLHAHLSLVLGPVLAASLLPGCTERRTGDQAYCATLPDSGTCLSREEAQEAYQGNVICDSGSPTVLSVVSEATRREVADVPSPDTGATVEHCCYDVTVRLNPGSDCIVGRPLVVEGTRRTARAERRTAWHAGPRRDATDLTPAQRQAVARWWTRTGLEEHASILAFGRVAAELMAHGAPPDLVARAHAAAADEVIHARDAFALASAAGSEVGPGPLQIPARAVPDLVTLAVETFVEGCVGETLASVVAAHRLAGCDDPIVREILGRVVADEARHAGLAWDILRWALATGGEPVREAVRAAAASLPSPTQTDEIHLPSWGLLGTRAAQHAADRGLVDVVHPTLASLV